MQVSSRATLAADACAHKHTHPNSSGQHGNARTSSGWRPALLKGRFVPSAGPRWGAEIRRQRNDTEDIKRFAQVTALWCVEADVGGGPDFDTPQTACSVACGAPLTERSRELSLLDEIQMDRDRRLKRRRNKEDANS